MPQNDIDLAKIFQAVTHSLAENQGMLNQLDTYNQDHGTNMVQTFQTITQALEAKQGSSASSALAYAAKTLAKNTTSGSGQLYAQNLTRASQQFQGKGVDAEGALQLLQTLIGSGQAGQSQADQGSGDMLGSLLGGLMGGETPAQSSPSSGGDLLGTLLGGITGEEASTPGQASSSSAGSDLLGTLLGGMTGGESSQQQDSGIDMQDLLAAGLGFLQAKQSGQGNLQALVQAFAAGSGMGNASHRDQSTQMVIQAFLQALSKS
jgi:hypothetical protein